MIKPFEESADAIYDLYSRYDNLLKSIKSGEVPDCFRPNFDVAWLEEIKEELHGIADKLRFLSAGADVSLDKRFSIIDWEMKPVSTEHKIYNINITGDIDVIHMFEDMCMSRTEESDG